MRLEYGVCGRAVSSGVNPLLEDSFDAAVNSTLPASDRYCAMSIVVRQRSHRGPRRQSRTAVNWGVNVSMNGTVAIENDRPNQRGRHSKRRVLHYPDTTVREIEHRFACGGGRHVQTSPCFSQTTWRWYLITTGKLGVPTEDRVVGVYVLDKHG